MRNKKAARLEFSSAIEAANNSRHLCFNRNRDLQTFFKPESLIKVLGFFSTLLEVND